MPENIFISYEGRDISINFILFLLKCLFLFLAIGRVLEYPESLCLLKTDRERQSTRLSEGVEILSEKKLCA